MALVLIADDDEKMRSTLQSALEGEGHEVLSAANGDEAVAQYESCVGSGREPDVVVLDVLMPKLGGLEAADALKKTGCRAHFIFMSGVFKSSQHAKDAEAKYGAKAYLSKPFGNRRLVELVASLPTRSQSSTGMQAAASGDVNLEVNHAVSSEGIRGGKRQKAPLPAEGSLLECPPIHLLWRVESERHTGVLDLFGVDNTGRFRLFFFKGRMTLAQSSSPKQNLGVQLIRDAHITSQMYEDIKTKAIERSRGIHEIIKSESIVDDNEIKQAYRALIPEIMADCIALSGQFRWTDSGDFARIIPSAPISTMDTAFKALRRATPVMLEPHVNPRGPLRLAPGTYWEEMSANLDEACGSSSLIRSINGRASIAMLVNAAKSEKDRAARMRQVYLLMSTQSVIASDKPIPMQTPPPTPVPEFGAPPEISNPAISSPVTAAAPTPRRAPVIIDHDDVAPADKKAREVIMAKLASLNGLDDFGILGVTAETSAAEIKGVYFELAREFHTDSFAGMSLGPAAVELDRLFAMIAEAYDNLTNPKKRAEIDARLMMEKAGMSTDVGALLEAENNFTKGQRLLERGEMIAAAKLFELCCDVNPSNIEWRCHNVYAGWWVHRDAARAPPVVKELEVAFREMPGIAQIAAFGGHVALESGDDRKSRILFRKALNIDANNNIAVRGMRIAQQRKQEADAPKKTGLMGRFLKR